MAHGYTVQDLINTKYLRYLARVVSGKAGLKKNVSWVHVLEIRDIVKDCVNGGEMILTTGIGFITEEIALKFMKELIEQGVSALCIETQLYYNRIGQALIDLAEANDFPLIEICEISRFVDITRGLNTMILDDDTQLIRDSDFYENHLSEIIGRGTITDGIRYTAEYLGIDIAYMPIRGQAFNVSPSMKQYVRGKLDVLNKALVDDEVYVGGGIAIKQLKIYDKAWGYLIFSSPGRALSQFELIILARLSGALKSDLHNMLLAREEKLLKDNSWLKAWLDGSLREEAIRDKLVEYGIPICYSACFVCCVSKRCPDHTVGSPILYDDFLIHSTLLAERIFYDEGFNVIGCMDDTKIIFIVLARDDVHTWERFNKAVEQLRHYENEFMDYSNANFSVGRKVGRLGDVSKSYAVAERMLEGMAECCGTTVIYDLLYIGQIMSTLKKEGVLGEFVQDHLGPLLRPLNEEALHTLKAFYDCGCSKQKTAERLFIARQTLYARLEKIEDLLGKGFDEGERRLAIEFAVHGYYYETGHYGRT